MKIDQNENDKQIAACEKRRRFPMPAALRRHCTDAETHLAVHDCSAVRVVSAVGVGADIASENHGIVAREFNFSHRGA